MLRSLGKLGMTEKTALGMTKRADVGIGPYEKAWRLKFGTAAAIERRIIIA